MGVAELRDPALGSAGHPLKYMSYTPRDDGASPGCRRRCYHRGRSPSPAATPLLRPSSPNPAEAQLSVLPVTEFQLCPTTLPAPHMRLSPRRRRLLLAAALALPLLAASQGEPPPPPPDDEFCGEAVEFNSSYLGTSMWMWLPEVRTWLHLPTWPAPMPPPPSHASCCPPPTAACPRHPMQAEPGQPDLPPEVLNATLAQFEAEYDATAAEGWVPCPPENLDVSYYGCQNVGTARAAGAQRQGRAQHKGRAGGHGGCLVAAWRRTAGARRGTPSGLPTPLLSAGWAKVQPARGS